jgi:hypothetical protein
MNYSEIMRAYGLYQCGMSLGKAAPRFNTTRGRLFDKFKRLNLKLRSNRKNEIVVFNDERFSFSLKNNDWRKTTGNRESLARVMWRFYNGEIPTSMNVFIINPNFPVAIDNIELRPIGSNSKLKGGM